MEDRVWLIAVFMNDLCRAEIIIAILAEATVASRDGISVRVRDDRIAILTDGVVVLEASGADVFRAIGHGLIPVDSFSAFPAEGGERVQTSGTETLIVPVGAGGFSVLFAADVTDESFFVHVHSLLYKAKPLRDFLRLGAVLNRILFSESQLVGFDGQLRSQQQTALGGVDLDGPVDVRQGDGQHIGRE